MKRRLDIRIHGGELNRFECINPNCTNILEIPKETRRLTLDCSCGDSIQLRLHGRKKDIKRSSEE